MSVRSQLGTARREMLCSLHRRSAPFGGDAVVSFSFDDFPRSAYLVGGAVLEEFGARGTYYTAVSLMNTTNELGEQFVLDDLHALLEKGHELASHTLNHISCRSVSLSEFRTDVAKGRQAIEELTGVNPRNFAYPFGDVTLRAKKALGPDLASARSIFPGFNGPNLDLNLLRANSLYGGLDRSSWLRTLIDENTRRKGWLIFYTHDVRANPSPFGCTPALLEVAVSAAVRSGSRIRTVQEVLSEQGIQNGNPKGSLVQVS